MRGALLSEAFVLDHMELVVESSPSTNLVYSNYVYMNEGEYSGLFGSRSRYVVILGRVFTASGLPSDQLKPGRIALSSKQRIFLRVELDKPVLVQPLVVPNDETLLLDSLTVDVGLLQRGRVSDLAEIDCKVLSEEMAQIFNDQVLCLNQPLVHKFRQSLNIQLTVSALTHVPKASSNQESAGPHTDLIENLKRGAGGILVSSTNIIFQKMNDHPIRLTGQAVKKSASKMMDTNFEKLGIGGLNKEFGDIFRRAFVSRILPSDVVKKLGIKHVRGLMLFGAPGCGKTLIARQISKVLQGGETAREPKLVSGPEILNKYVGESEKNIRELFADAEEEQLAAGDDSELHVIIFDEIDAICKKRGKSNDGTGVGDSVVNQLLSKIDGVNSLNNVLLIGMTNRLDMIDPALLRPGRFEVQIEIGLPDEPGRVQILNIHTKSMRDGGCLSPDVDVASLAKDTKNFSGAEIEGLVKSAVSFATNRHINIDDLAKASDLDALIVLRDDFESALEEVHPAFGMQGEEEIKLLFRNGIISYSSIFSHFDQTMRDLATQVQTSPRTPLLSLLVAGPGGCGKTAQVAKLATDAGFPFTKLITADSMIGMGEQQKCSYIAQVFEDSYRSPVSLIIMDDIERLIDYVSIGPRFSNLVLQALLVLINKTPPKENRKLMVIGTTAIPDLLESMGLTQVFNVVLHCPLLTTDEEVETMLAELMKQSRNETDPLKIDPGEMKLISAHCKKPMPVKKLLVVVEMARQGEPVLSYNRFMECLNSIGY